MSMKQREKSDKLAKKGSPWIALNFAKFFRGPFTYADLEMMNPVVFKAKSDKTRRAIYRLLNSGYIREVSKDVFEVTAKGIDMLNKASIPYMKPSKTGSQAKQQTPRR